jgi:hypothetical protein
LVFARVDDTPLPFNLPSVRRKKLTVDFAGGGQSAAAASIVRVGGQADNSETAARLRQ